MGYEILGYFAHEKDIDDLSANNVMVVIDEGEKGRLTYYCPIGQHSWFYKEYLNECVEISKEDYKKVSKLFYTPEDYL